MTRPWDHCWNVPTDYSCYTARSWQTFVLQFACTMMPTQPRALRVLRVAGECDSPTVPRPFLVVVTSAQLLPRARLLHHPATASAKTSNFPPAFRFAAFGRLTCRCDAWVPVRPVMNAMRRRHGPIRCVVWGCNGGGKGQAALKDGHICKLNALCDMLCTPYANSGRLNQSTLHNG